MKDLIKKILRESDWSEDWEPFWYKKDAKDWVVH